MTPCGGRWRRCPRTSDNNCSVRTARWQYTEYYHRGAVSFREFYPARDVYQLQNRLHDGNPANNPDVAALLARLDAVRRCAGAGCP